MVNRNVVIVGEQGSGKSFLVKRLFGSDQILDAVTITGGTFKYQKYSSKSYNLYDTVGLNERSHHCGPHNGSHGFAAKQLINLLQSLKGGVSLFIFVVKPGIVSGGLYENYKLFVETICMKKVPVLLVITGSGQEVVQGDWWTTNKDSLDKYGMTFHDVIVGCCVSPENASSSSMDKAALRALSRSRSTLIQLAWAIQTNMLTPGWIINAGWKCWLKNTFTKANKVFCKVLGLPWEEGNPQDFQTRLKIYFVDQGYEPHVAGKMASDIAYSV